MPELPDSKGPDARRDSSDHSELKDISITFRPWLNLEFLPSESNLHPSQILEDPKLFISHWRTPKDKKFLQENNIRFVISLNRLEHERIEKNDSGILGSFENQKFFTSLGITRHLIEFSDDKSARSDKIKTAYQYLKEAISACSGTENAILLHCAVGLSRSPAMLAAYIKRANKCTFREAVQQIATRRNVLIDQDLASIVCETLKIKID